MPRARRGHTRFAPGAKKGRPGRLKRGKTRLTQRAWDKKLQEFLPKAPKKLETLEEKMEWAMEQMYALYRLGPHRGYH